MSISHESLISDGWECLDVDGFTGIVDPFWRRHEEDGVVMGLLLREDHTNNHLGTVHGGVVMTFADIGLGSGVAEVMGAERFRCVTTSLQTQFISTAKVGEFIYCQPEVVRQNKQVIFVRGLIKTGDKTIASVEGIWSVLLKSA